MDEEKFCYKVLDDDEMDELTESIREHGILSPLIVRPLDGADGEYEVISGHRRLHAAQTEAVQRHIAALIERDEATPSYSQAVRMHKENGQGFSAITDERIDEIMAEDKPNQRERASLPLEQLRRFFPENYTPKEMQDAIMKLIQVSYEPLPQKKPLDRGAR